MLSFYHFLSLSYAPLLDQLNKIDEGDTQVGKEEVQVCLFADDIILYVETLNASPENSYSQ